MLLLGKSFKCVVAVFWLDFDDVDRWVGWASLASQYRVRGKQYVFGFKISQIL